MKIFSFFGVGLLALVGLYIFQINSFTANAYGATAAEKKLTQLRKTTINIQTTIAQNRSIQSTPELAAQFHFEKVDKVQYMRVLASSVAQK